MPGVPPIQGVVAYDFREAINKLACSSADAATLAACWYDLCNTKQAMDVTIELSSGESMTVPNLAKAIQSLKERRGDVDASVVRVRQSGSASLGVDVKPQGVDVGTTRAKYADGTARSQHSYSTPYNTYYDFAYVSNSAVCYDSFEFLEIPRFLWFNDESSLNELGAHVIALKPLASTAELTLNRSDKKGVCLCAKFTLVNADSNRTGTFLITNDTAGGSVAASVTLAPGQHADFLVWCWRGFDACNVAQL